MRNLERGAPALINCRLTSVALAAGLVICSTARAEDRADARGIIDSAIDAAGGREALARYRQAFCYECEVANSFPSGRTFKATETATKLLPDKMRLAYKSENVKPVPIVVWVVDGNKGWLTNTSQTKTVVPQATRMPAPMPPRGRAMPVRPVPKPARPPVNPPNSVEEMTPESLAGCRDRLYAQWVSTLLPLDDEAFELRVIDDAAIDGILASVVEVKRASQTDVRLYFDKGTSLLVRMAWGQIEQHFAEPAELDGLIYATKVTDYLNGKMLREARVTKLEFLDSVEDGTFEKPLR